MEITKEILESILDAYSYEIVFVDRQHIPVFRSYHYIF